MLSIAVGAVILTVGALIGAALVSYGEEIERKRGGHR